MTEEVKYRNPIDALGYVNLHHAIALDTRISHGALRLYLLYHYHAQQKAMCWPSRGTLGDLLGVDKRTVQRWNAELVDAGYITREERIGESSITYIEPIYQNPGSLAVALDTLSKRNKGGVDKNVQGGVDNDVQRGWTQMSHKELTNEELTNEEILADVFEDDFEDVVEYVEEGDEFGDKDPKRKRRFPKTSLQVRMCNATGRRYLAPDEVTKISKIEKGMMSLSSGLTAKYPTEWVDMCVEWAQNKNLKKGTVITMQGLLGFINNEKRKAQFLAEYQQKHGKVSPNPYEKPIEDDDKMRKAAEEWRG